MMQVVPAHRCVTRDEGEELLSNPPTPSSLENSVPTELSKIWVW